MPRQIKGTMTANPEKLSREELAKKCKISRNMVQKRLREGYTEQEILDEYAEKNGVAKLSEHDKSPEGIREIKIGKEKAQKELAEANVIKVNLQNAKLSGELVAMADVQELFIFFASITKAQLKNMANQLVGAIEGKSAVEIAPLMQGSIDSTLEGISKEIISRIENL